MIFLDFKPSKGCTKWIIIPLWNTKNHDWKTEEKHEKTFL